MKWLPLAAAFVTSILLFPGCGGSSATVRMTQQAPVLRSVEITPEDLRFSFDGGKITLRVTVDSERAIDAVTAERSLLNSPKPETKLYPLVPVASGANVYQTSVDVPANTRPDGQPVHYRLSVFATDVAGVQSDRVEREIRVAAPDASGLPSVPFNP